jgi:SAM-dependent methyltransferase
MAMRRETVNVIRYVLEDIVPPFLRDSFAFRWVATLAWGRHIADLAEFRKRAPYVSDAEYEAIYRAHPPVHEDTDNSRACVARVVADVTGESVLDVGCGSGHLIRQVRDRAGGAPAKLAAIDFALGADNDWRGIETHRARIERLPFPDRAFDTVMCTHVLEHILDLRAMVAELRRVTRKRLLVVVPLEREYRYTFNPHFHFFPYPESFLRAMIPLPSRHQCEAIGRDIYYREERDE